MLLHFRSPHQLLRRTLVAALVGLVPQAAHAQTRWRVDPKTSLAWWQVSPHLNHLWATTCPADSSWRPGAGRSSGWYINPALKLPKTGFGNVDDTVNVPLYPRDRVYPVCVEAVQGEVVVPDTMTWRGVHGQLRVLGEALITGQRTRDRIMHYVMETEQYPEITFTLDSLVSLTKHADTVLATAVGTFEMSRARMLITGAVRAFPDASGMRVLAKCRIPAADLQIELLPKLEHMGLGVNTSIWKDFFMGVDLVFRPAEPATGQQ